MKVVEWNNNYPNSRKQRKPSNPRKHTQNIQPWFYCNICGHNNICSGSDSKSIQFTILPWTVTQSWFRKKTRISLFILILPQNTFSDSCSLQLGATLFSAVYPAIDVSSPSLQAFTLFAPTTSCSNTLFSDNSAKSLLGVWFLWPVFGVCFSLRFTPWSMLIIKAAQGSRCRFTTFTSTLIDFGVTSLRAEGQHEKSMLNNQYF